MNLRKIIVSLAAAFLLLYSLPVSAEKPGGMVSEEKTAISIDMKSGDRCLMVFPG